MVVVEDQVGRDEKNEFQNGRGRVGGGYRDKEQGRQSRGVGVRDI